MKKNMKRVISTIVALCILLASASCLMGMTASANDEVKAFGVEVWSTEEKKISFYDTASSKDLYEAYTGLKTGDTVRVTFDYFTDSTGFSVRPYSDLQGEEVIYSGSSQFGNHEKAYLDVGKGKFDLTFTATADREDKSLMPYLSINGAGAVVGKVLYFWNVEITFDRVDGEDVTITTDDLQIYKSDDTATKISPTTYNVDDMKTVWSWTPADNYLKFVMSGYKQWQTTSDDLQNPATGIQAEVGDTFQISFDYYVTGDANDGDFVIESTSGWGSDEFGDKLYINEGRGTASKTFTINSKGNNGIQPLIKYYGEGDATLNIWNLKFTKAGVDTQVHLYSNDNKYPSVTSVNALNIPADDEDDGETPEDTTVFYCNDGWENQTMRFDVNGESLASVVWGQNEGETVSISFDYYNPENGKYMVRKYKSNSSSDTWDWNGDAEGTGSLQDLYLSKGVGRMELSYTATGTDETNTAIEPTIFCYDTGVGSTGKPLYIWNVTISVHHYKNDEWHDVTFSGNEITGLYDYQGNPYPTTTYGELDLPQDEDEILAFAWENPGEWDVAIPLKADGDDADTNPDQIVTDSAVVGETTYRVTFDYYNPIADSSFTVKNYSGNGSTGETTFSTGSGSKDVTLVASAEGSFAAGIQSDKDHTGTIYIWNIRLWVNGEVVEIVGLSNATQIAYEDIPTDDNDDDDDEEIPADKKVLVFKTRKVEGTVTISSYVNGTPLATTFWKVIEDESVSVSFDYYNPNFTGWRVQAYTDFDNHIKDYATHGNSDEAYLDVGLGRYEGSWSAAKTDDNASIIPTIRYNGAENFDEIQELYVWNLSVTITRWDEGTQQFVPHTIDMDDVDYTYETGTSYTYNPISIDNVPLALDWTPAEDEIGYLKFWGSSYLANSYKTRYTELDIILNNVKVNEEVEISFDYVIENLADGDSYQLTTLNGAELDKSVDITANQGTITETFVVVKGGALQPIFKFEGEETGSTISISNLKFKYNDKNYTVNLEYNDGTGTADPKTTVYVWEDAGVEEYMRFGGFGSTQLCQGIASIVWGQDVGEEVRISFDYYNPDSGSYEIRKNCFGEGWDWNGDEVGTGYGSQLIFDGGLGHGDFAWIITEADENGTVEPVLHSFNNNSGKTLYIWNVKIWVKYYKDGHWYEVQYTPEDLTHIYPANNAVNNADGVLSTITYDQLVIVPYTDGTPEEIEENKMMVKMESYKYREDMDLNLKYNQFTWVCNAKYCKEPIKPETTYVFEFEYYCDPGPWELGNTAPSCLVRTLSSGTGEGSVRPNSNLDMYWNEYSQKYDIMILKPTIGRAKAVMEFNTIANQTDFFVGLQQGHDGDLYAWDFKLYEKGGDGTNLLSRSNFYGEWEEYANVMSPSKAVKEFMVLENSYDGNGAFSFVPFNQEIADLAYGKYIVPELPDDYFDNLWGDEEDDDYYYDDDDDYYGDYEDDDIAETGDTSNTAVAVAVMALALAVITVTSRRILRRKD